jgi:hypothetical protein
MPAGADRVLEDVKVIMTNTGGDVIVATAGEILPGAFRHGMMENEPG